MQSFSEPMRQAMCELRSAREHATARNSLPVRLALSKLETVCEAAAERCVSTFPNEDRQQASIF